MMREIIPDLEAMKPRPIVLVTIGEKRYHVSMEKNSSAEAFIRKLSTEGRLKIAMRDYGHFEKVGDLPWKLVTNDKEITTKPGDLILFQGDKIAIYYDENTWNFTKLGSLYVNSKEEYLKTVGGSGDVETEFFVEWTE